MSIRVIVVAALTGFFAFGSGCDNTHCEEGAVCLDGEETESLRGRECLMYCARLGTCGAAQADDFDQCTKDCEKSFQKAPQATARLCACAEWSACEDVVEGRCSSPSSGTGGAPNGTGGAPNGTGGGCTRGCTAGASGAGGSPTDAGVSGSSGDAARSCTRDCDCPLSDLCRGGYCIPAEAAAD
ncbi:MAG TPA: hypothetical protein VK524_30450 [Polyangiaceae bacterium]|nr:hypothetical protein [Polyangiaceae bacterium]